MKIKILKLIAAFMLVAGHWSLITPVVYGQTIPSLISFQGRLTDDLNNPLAGSYDFTFAIYADLTGGPPLWSETQSGITVANGVLTAQLGSATPLPATIFSAAQRYLEIRVGATTLAPRQRLLSVPYALYSSNLGTSGSQAVISTDVVVSSSQFRIGNFASLPVAVGPGSVIYDSVANRIKFWNGAAWSSLESGGASPWTYDAGNLTPGSMSDKVGVGKMPGEKLDVGGNIKSDYGIMAATAAIGNFVYVMNGSFSVGTDSPAAGFHVQSYTAGVNTMYISTSATAGQYSVEVSSTGITRISNLVIEARTADPASPETGQIWLITP